MAARTDILTSTSSELIQMLNITHKSIVKACIFLVLSLLLSTNNFSVAIAGAMVIYSLFYLSINRREISVDNTDWIVLGVLSAYLLSNIPLAIIDWGNFRYFRGASRLLLCIPIYIMIKSVITDSKSYLSSITWGVIVGSIGALCIALYQFIIEERVRVDGFLYSINFGYLACILAVLSLALYRGSKHKRILLVSFTCAASAMLMTLTRGAIFTLPLIIILAILLNRQHLTFKNSLSILMLTLLTSTSLYNISPTFSQRIDYTIQEFSYIVSGETKKATSTGGRVLLWEASFEAFKSNPIVGLTHPQRESLNKALATEDNKYSWVAGVSRGHAHSQYFDMLASGGLLGMLAIIMMLVVPLIYFIKHHKHSNYAYIGLLFVSTYALICLTEVALQQNLISTFYGFMISLLFALTKADVKQITCRTT